MTDNRRKKCSAEAVDTTAAEYVLGTLSAEERAAVDKAMTGDAALCARVAFWQEQFQGMADMLEPVAPAPHVFEAIEAAIDGAPQPGSITIRADEGEWQPLFDGVFKKMLLADEGDGSESYLLRIEPGAACPAHGHSKTEECLVLEGEMIIGTARFKAGDYHAAPPDVPHLPITSEIGALLYIRAEMRA